MRTHSEQVGAHVFPGEIISRQYFRLADELGALAPGDDLAAKEHPHITRTLRDMQPMSRIAMNRHTFLSDIALHTRVLLLTTKCSNLTLVNRECNRQESPSHRSFLSRHAGAGRHPGDGGMADGI